MKHILLSVVTLLAVAAAAAAGPAGTVEKVIDTADVYNVNIWQCQTNMSRWQVQ